MSDKFSSDNGMQKLFESFRKTINEQSLEEANAMHVGTITAKSDSIQIMQDSILIDLVLANGEEYSLQLKINPAEYQELKSISEE